jgi:hypothetical protein
MNKHIVYYNANKKMKSKSLEKMQEKQNKQTSRLEFSDESKTLTKPLDINISLTTPKFILKIIIKSVPISQNEFLVNSSCLFMTR